MSSNWTCFWARCRNKIQQENCDFILTKCFINVNWSSWTTDCEAKNSKPQFMLQDWRGDQPSKNRENAVMQGLLTLQNHSCNLPAKSANFVKLKSISPPLFQRIAAISWLVSHIFARWTSKKTYCHARIARDSCMAIGFLTSAKQGCGSATHFRDCCTKKK